MAPLLAQLSSPAGRLFIIFTFLYLCTIYYLSYFSNASLNPGSAFFDPPRAFAHPYSTQREAAGRAFIKHAENNPSAVEPPPLSLDTSPRTLCLGFPSVRRPHEQYLPTMFGSLLSNLSYTDRADMYLIPLIGHINASDHPFYNDNNTWLTRLSDRILLYSALNDTEEYSNDTTLTPDDYAYVAHLEETHQWGLKEIFDYAFLLETCLQTNTPYIGIIEDDTVAVEGWYTRLTTAIDEIEDRTAEWLYVRMFFTEQYLGWNSEEWGTYSRNIFLAYLVPIVGVLLLRYYTGRKPSLQVLGVVFCYILPLCILLVFLRGRPPLKPGVQVMNKYGCCTQGMVFPREVVPQIIEFVRAKDGGFIDLHIEELADKTGLPRWAAVPSLLQHVGGRGSRGDDMENGKYGMSVSEITWSIGFEGYGEGGSYR